MKKSFKITLIISFIAIILIAVFIYFDNKQYFLEKADQEEFAVLLEVSKSIPDNKAEVFAMKIRDIDCKTYSKPYFYRSESENYIHMRYNIYSDSKCSKSDVLTKIDSVIKELGIENFIKMAVMGKNGLEESSNGFVTDRFP